MSNDQSGRRPTPVLVLGSVLIAGHLLAVLSAVLAAPSGPWPTDGGNTMSTPPQFAYTLNRLFADRYLRLVGMANNYHFFSNQPAVPGVWFEVRLKDDAGNPISTLRFPDPDANFAIRHRQGLLARGLIDDRPVDPPQGEKIAAPNRSVPTERIWEPVGDGQLELKHVPEHLIPRDRPVLGPSEQSWLLARSYSRYLCHRHGAATAEVIRKTQGPIAPAVMFIPGRPPDDAAGKLTSSFGELPQ